MIAEVCEYYLTKKGVYAMPGGDRTGPAGYGPRTGRAAGFCAGFDSPGFMNPGFGGRGRGMGFGRGWRRGTGGAGYGWGRGGGYGPGRGAGYGYGRYYSRTAELEDLQGYADSLEAELKSVKQEIQSLETEETSEK